MRRTYAAAVAARDQEVVNALAAAAAERDRWRRLRCRSGRRSRRRWPGRLEEARRRRRGRRWRRPRRSTPGCGPPGRCRRRHGAPPRRRPRRCHDDDHRPPPRRRRPGRTGAATTDHRHHRPPPPRPRRARPPPRPPRLPRSGGGRDVPSAGGALAPAGGGLLPGGPGRSRRCPSYAARAWATRHREPGQRRRRPLPAHAPVLAGAGGGAGFPGASPFDPEANIAAAAWLVRVSLDGWAARLVLLELPALRAGARRRATAGRVLYAGRRRRRRSPWPHSTWTPSSSASASGPPRCGSGGSRPSRGQARRRYVEAAEQDHMDYSLIAGGRVGGGGRPPGAAHPAAPLGRSRVGRVTPGRARLGASARLGPSLRLEPLQAVLAGVDEAHGVGDGPVAGLVADEAVHLGADPAVAGMAARPGCAAPAGGRPRGRSAARRSGCGRRGARRTGRRRRPSASARRAWSVPGRLHGPAPVGLLPGVGDAFGDHEAVPGAQPLPVDGQDAVALQVAEDPVVAQQVEAVAGALHAPARLVAAVAPLPGVGGDEAGHLGGRQAGGRSAATGRRAGRCRGRGPRRPPWPRRRRPSRPG